MTPWIQVYSNFPGHRKTCKLRDLLGLKHNYEAAGLLVCLWTWAAVNATDGDLTGYNARDIADATGWKKAAGKLLEALVTSGFLERGEDGKVTIHDWDEHAALLQDAEAQQRRNTRDRVRRYRERQKQKEGADVTPPDDEAGNVTCNAGNAPTLPNLTLPLLSGGDGESAGAREATESELAGIGLKPGEYIGVSAELVETVRGMAQSLISRYASGRCCTTLDCRKVFILTAWGTEVDGMKTLNTDAAGLLEYAFEQALLNGKPAVWSYIEGILGRCALRNIWTAEAARQWDEERPDMEQGVGV